MLIVSLHDMKPRSRGPSVSENTAILYYWLVLMGQDANGIALLTSDGPFVCLSLDMGPTGNIPCFIQDPVQSYAQCQCSCSVLLTRNEGSNVRPCA
jgi:hypothetical protein